MQTENSARRKAFLSSATRVSLKQSEEVISKEVASMHLLLSNTSLLESSVNCLD